MKKIILTVAISIIVLAGSDSVKSATEEVCPGPVPKNWAIIGTRTCAGCCTPGQLSTMLKIKNTEKMEIGSSLTICPDSDIPEGWSIVKTIQRAGGCGKAGQLVKMRTIKKLSDNKDD